MSVPIKIEGLVYKVGDEQVVSSKFTKRELVIETIEENQQYNQLISIQFTNDKVDLIDSLRAGDSILVSANLRGREWKSPSGDIKFFNSIEGWAVQIRGRAEQPTPPVPAFDMSSDDPFGMPEPPKAENPADSQLFDEYGNIKK
jgi:hypothetical protein